MLIMLDYRSDPACSPPFQHSLSGLPDDVCALSPHEVSRLHTLTTSSMRQEPDR